jgi:DNA adenine methylase
MGENEIILPFLKWAGGKRWLTSSHPNLLHHPFERYIEPFLGSGAVFFHLTPQQAVLADRNPELIEAYQAIKDDWKLVEQELQKHHKNHSKRYYYAIRDSRPRLQHTRAAKFIYLNRTCWNGLYRVNLRGEFNVPVGTKTNVVMDTDNFQAIALLLQTAELRVSDFEPIIDQAGPNDLIFVDPPYTVNHNLNGFIKYNEILFSWKDQIRLRDCIGRAKDRGASIVLTNAYHKSIKQLYREIGTHIRLKRSNVLAADITKRKICAELLVVI